MWLTSVSILLFAVTLWLGLYLLARDFSKEYLRWAGLGLVAYALAFAIYTLQLAANGSIVWARIHTALLMWPPCLWLASMAALAPATWPLRVWRLVCAPVAFIVTALILFSDWVFGPLFLVYGFLVVGSALSALLIAIWIYRATPNRSLSFLSVGALFFAMSSGSLFLQLDGWSPEWALVLIGLDVLWLGVSIAAFDAFAEGETLLPDMLRSLTASALQTGVFGGLMVLALWFSGGVNFIWLVLIFATVAAAIATQVFADTVQSTLDALIFARLPNLRRTRADLRAVASALPRAEPTVNLATMEEAEFVRLTRRALSHLGDLPRLAASPLTTLPALSTAENALERATQLKLLLTASIQHLKPPGPAEFGTSDEWRHYNALYFPYVCGLKPYARRAEPNGHSAASLQALAWFQTSVPERTLHNWQNAAAKLVAQHLREVAF